jgi:hypothetical protein
MSQSTNTIDRDRATFHVKCAKNVKAIEVWYSRVDVSSLVGDVEHNLVHQVMFT